MNQSMKLFIASTVMVSSVVALPLTQVSAEAQIVDVVYEHEGSFYTISYTDYAFAMFDKKGSLYTFLTEKKPTIKALGIGNDVYVNYMDVALAILDNTTGKSSMEIFTSVSNDTKSHIGTSVASEFQTVIGYEQDGNPIAEGQEVVPKVISIE